MEDKDFELILKTGESYFVEFKEGVDKGLVKEIVAFSNSQGGRIFIGVTDSGEIKGIKVTNKLKSQIFDAARNCDPSIDIKLSTYKNKVLVVEVPEGDKKPYSCSQGFFIRNGPNSQKLSRDEILSFAYTEGRLTFDEQINEDFIYPDDFDRQKFSDYLKEARLTDINDDESLLIILGVAKKVKSKILLNNAGVLFFAKDPAKFFMSSKVVCAEYQTNDKANILDRKIYDEGILENIKQAINFVKRRIKIEFEIKTARRKEIPQYPEEAYREVIVNAIMHRDYFDKSSDVMVEVYRNKIVVFNPGGLVKWLKPEEFGTISKTRNPIIASLLARTIFVEKMGTGINRIRKAMKSSNLPAPEFKFYEHSFYTTLFDKTMIKGAVAEPQKTVEKTGQKIRNLSRKELLTLLENKVGSRLVEKVGSKLVENQLKIILLILEDEKITKNKMSEILNISDTAVDKNILKLKNLGIIKRVGPAKGGHWEVKEQVIMG
ncbi:MAG: putative DNA binding domain-containing protein [Methanophagales archaeon]|nr:putative DNA binding domain-containing protein [Methanophagales archaeon]